LYNNISIKKTAKRQQHKQSYLSDTRTYFFDQIELTMAIGSGLDQDNYAQVGGAIQSKEHSRVTDPDGRVDSICSKNRPQVNGRS